MVAVKMFRLCSTARQVSEYAAGWLHRQPAVKEESLTDWLLDYFDQKSTGIRYYQFTRHEEGRSSGADWDWWILLSHGCFKIRVQAKKLKKNHDHYQDLARSNKTGYQLDVLLDSSARFNFYPIYSLYGFSEGVGRCARTIRPEPLHICSAQEIYDLVFSDPRSRLNSSTLLALSIPLTCLFCCPLYIVAPDANAGDLFDHYFTTPPSPRGGHDEGNPDRNRGFELETPPIIKQLFNIEEINDNTEPILRFYQETFPGSNGVGIIRPDRQIEG